MSNFELQWFGDDIRKQFLAESKLRIDDINNSMVEQIKQDMEGPKTGQIYKHPKGGTYQASAIGESPAARRGSTKKDFLIDTITSKIKATKFEVRGHIGTQDPVGLLLHENFGPHPHRPFLLIALQQQQQIIGQILRRKWLR